MNLNVKCETVDVCARLSDVGSCFSPYDWYRYWVICLLTLAEREFLDDTAGEKARTLFTDL